MVNLDPAFQTFLTALGGFFAASGGFWIYLKRKLEARDKGTLLLMALVYDRIIHYGITYIEQGYVTKDEYNDLVRYFWEPYKAIGGNGTAERIMNMVQTLPLTRADRMDDLDKAIHKLSDGAEAVINQVKEEGPKFDRPR